MSSGRGSAARWRGPVVWGVGVAALLLLPSAFLPGFEAPVALSFGPDKIVHFLLVLGLTRSWYLALAVERRRPGLEGFVLAAVFGAGLEGLQTVSPGLRTGEPGDALANALGALAAVVWCTWRRRRNSADPRGC